MLSSRLPGNLLHPLLELVFERRQVLLAVDVFRQRNLIVGLLGFSESPGEAVFLPSVVGFGPRVVGFGRRQFPFEERNDVGSDACTGASPCCPSPRAAAA